ncbi:MAG: 2-amino-4-hydroxy-6-hydroxymethyldihydropteridine diphosphokinase [Ignavibacteria bacterium]|jgi:2-amino-4-hydroxy-6-hydroxymethyldihydropteridine diphosphokinase|nr:2-amino-4-hydroxy-6-hydroxymethyldihydropteridine diphosphokinase [Ignavibacteria bacterium]
MAKVFLGLGSNIGDRKKYLEEAIQEIKNIPGTKVLKLSSVYETEPWGFSEQEEYLNAVIEIETEQAYEKLLKEVKAIEIILGRDKRDKWKSRKIDIDILFYGDLVYEDENLHIPHKHIEDRNFVLVPLNEIEPDFVHPITKKKISEILQNSKDKLKAGFHSKFEQ